MELTSRTRALRFGRLLVCGAMLFAAGAPVSSSVVLAGEKTADNRADSKVDANEWSQRAWRIAKSGRFDDFVSYIHDLPDDPTIGAEHKAEMERSVKLLDENYAKRDQKRVERIA